MKDILKIAKFLEERKSDKDSKTIDYISQKYADGDIEAFFKLGINKDFINSEFGELTNKKIAKVPSEEEEDMIKFFKKLSAAIK